MSDCLFAQHNKLYKLHFLEESDPFWIHLSTRQDGDGPLCRRLPPPGLRPHHNLALRLLSERKRSRISKGEVIRYIISGCEVCTDPLYLAFRSMSCCFQGLRQPRQLQQYYHKELSKQRGEVKQTFHSVAPP